MQRLIPCRIDRGSEKFAPARIKTAASAGHIAVAEENHLRVLLRCRERNEVTDILITIRRKPVCRGPFFQISWAIKNIRSRKFVRAEAEMVDPSFISDFHGSTVGYVEIPGEFVVIIECPHF